jgi:hypothetical protein
MLDDLRGNPRFEALVQGRRCNSIYGKEAADLIGRFLHAGFIMSLYNARSELL